MPEISAFYGISIYIYYNEHQPPHFHAIYGEREALISIASLSVIAGALPPRSLGLVIEWASIHKAELETAWARAMRHEKPNNIEPLD